LKSSLINRGLQILGGRKLSLKKKKDVVAIP
jgi:hypothetical protein